MSVHKLLARIVSPLTAQNGADAARAHNQSYGITSDPMTQWSCLLAALAHDVVRWWLVWGVFDPNRLSFPSQPLESPWRAKFAIHQGKSYAWSKV